MGNSGNKQGPTPESAKPATPAASTKSAATTSSAGGTSSAGDYTGSYYPYSLDEGTGTSEISASASGSGDGYGSEADDAAEGGSDGDGSPVRTKGIFDSHIKGILEMRKGDFDPNFTPSVQPKVKPKALNKLARRFFQALGLWHLTHVAMAAAFMYFSIQYVNTAFTGNKTPQICISNGTLIDYGAKFPGGSDEYNTCHEYDKWLQINATDWKKGVIIYCVFNGVAALLSIIYSYYVYRRLTKLQPKDSAAVLKSIFYGFPKGSFMVSYAWKDDPDQFGRPTGELPRKIGSFFPAAWLDIENLIPGTPVKAACRNAAAQAMFRFVFISTAYLASPNCQAEWEKIVKEPGHAFVFAYPNTDPKVLKKLERDGHLVVRLTEQTRAEIMTADWWFTHFLRSRRANPLFQLYSPGINERWRSTLRFWHGEGSWSFFTLSFPLILGSCALVGIDFLVAYYWKFQILFVGFEGTAFLFAFALVLPVIQLFVGIYVFTYLFGTGYHKKDLPDVGYLLAFLNHVGIIDQIKFYSNSDDVWKRKEFEVFASTKALKVVKNADEADIRCLLLDDVPDGQYTKEEVDERYVFWTRGGFLGLSQYAKDTFGQFIIGDEVPGVEFLGSKILMHVFHVGAEDLVVGSKPFETLFLKKDSDNKASATKGGRCANCCAPCKKKDAKKK